MAQRSGYANTDIENSEVEEEWKIMKKNMKNDLVIPRSLWHVSPATELRISFEIIKDETYGTAIYKPTKTRGICGFEYRLEELK